MARATTGPRATTGSRSPPAASGRQTRSQKTSNREIVVEPGETAREASTQVLGSRKRRAPEPTRQQTRQVASKKVAGRGAPRQPTPEPESEPEEEEEEEEEEDEPGDEVPDIEDTAVDRRYITADVLVNLKEINVDG
jgi:hypothetical protein